VTRAGEWIDRIRALPLPERVRVLNVCGGHERTVSMSGLRSVLPAGVEIIPGPGCPVCVCPEEDIHLAIEIARRTNAVLAAFGDMLRVPANVPRGQPRTLEQARAAGADVVPVASPQQVWRLAEEHPDKQVVFFAAGFETTMAPVAARVIEGIPSNLKLLISGRRTWPAVELLLDSHAPGFEALVAPGHVATIMGVSEWAPVADVHGLPTAVGGFEVEHLLAALYSVLGQSCAGLARLDNCYPEVVRPEGNRVAQRLLSTLFTVDAAPWRGIGVIAASGYTLRSPWARHDARIAYAELADQARRHAGQMPAGCACAEVVMGRIYPTACPLYGRTCTPAAPVGPCMVSDEGACRIWWSAGKRRPDAPEAALG